MSTQSPAAPVPQKNSLLSSRLGSFLAVVPLGVWVFIHLWNNLAAFQGAQAWEDSVTGYKHPYAQALTWVIVFLPLLWHTGWGIKRLFSLRPNNVRYGTYDNLKYLLQRLSAVGLLAFLGAHIYLAFLQPRLGEGRAEPFADIAGEMHHHMPTLVVYLLGTLAVSYHLAYGLQSFFMSWGVLSSERSVKRFEPVVIGLFVLFLAMSWGAIYALYQAGAGLAH
ncbi:MAG TPA: succinate dehydrogenase [Aggregicoccus sp.]|nr:succinate dehydrogenase [Aggregicoccus sp.]